MSMINEEVASNFPGVWFFKIYGVRGLLDGSLMNCLVTTYFSDTGPSTCVLRGRKIGGLLDMLLALLCVRLC
jgi:hypothetical protein